MSISIEKVDQVLGRVPYASYADVKAALIEADGDVLDAIILIEEKYSHAKEPAFKMPSIDKNAIKDKLDKEREKLKDSVDSSRIKDAFDSSRLKDAFDTSKIKDSFDSSKIKDSIDAEKLKAQLKELFRKSTVIRVIVEKDGKTIINMPLAFGAIGVVLLPELGLLVGLLGLSMSMLANYKIKLLNEDGDREVVIGRISEEKLIILKDMLMDYLKGIKSTFDGDDESLNECTKDEEADDKDSQPEVDIMSEVEKQAKEAVEKAQDAVKRGNEAAKQAAEEAIDEIKNDETDSPK